MYQPPSTTTSNDNYDALFMTNNNDEIHSSLLDSTNINLNNSASPYDISEKVSLSHSKTHRIVGTPCRFSVDPNDQEEHRPTSLGQSGLNYTGIPQSFGIDPHPMTFYSSLSEIQCSLCCKEIDMTGGYRCHSCKTILCLDCSRIQDITSPPSPLVSTILHKGCDLTYKMEETMKICSKCEKKSQFLYICTKHQYYLCLWCHLMGIKPLFFCGGGATLLKRTTGVRSGHPSDVQVVEDVPPPRPTQALPSPSPSSSPPPPKHSLSRLQVPIFMTRIQRFSRVLPAGIKTKQLSTDEQFLCIFVESAEGLLPADRNGLSDPYCVVSVTHDKKQLRELTGCSRSQTVFKNLNPKWDCNFIFPCFDFAKMELKVIFELWDYDEGWTDDELGKCEFTINNKTAFGKQQTGQLTYYKAFSGTTNAGKLFFTISIKSSKDLGEVDEEVLEWRRIVEHVGHFPIVPTYYQRFRRIFFVPYIEKNTCLCTFYSIENNSILDQKFARGEKFAEIKENGRTYHIDLVKGVQTWKSFNAAGGGGSGVGGGSGLSSSCEPEMQILSAGRLEKWFWKDDGGEWRPFNDETQARIWQAYIYRLPTMPVNIGKNEYIIDLNEKRQKNLKNNRVRELTTEKLLEQLSSWTVVIPNEEKDEKTQLLPLVYDKDEEYKYVQNFFYITMPCTLEGKPINAIKGINKILNFTLRRFWANELDMCKRLNKDQPITEYTRLLWHGTSQTNPELIYNSTKGWKVNYAGEGNLWGKGLYFSQDAVYSSGKYAYTTSRGTQLLLLAEVIVGSSIYLQESKETKKMKDAPMNPDTKITYDCVIGNRHGTWIFVTYESSRAYPAYVVEYDPNG